MITYAFTQAGESERLNAEQAYDGREMERPIYHSSIEMAHEESGPPIFEAL